MLERLLQQVTAEQGAWIATVGEVAAHHAASANAERYTVPVRVPELIAEARFGRER
jgi:hypothetical protein